MSFRALVMSGVFAVSLVLAGAAQAATPGTHVLGNPKAPIVIEDYASLTCPHCGDFYEKTLPELEKKYIDTGKVAFIFRDFPLDGIGLKAAALAHCMPEGQYHPFIRILYKNLRAWLSNPEQILVQYARLGGLEESKAKACLNDNEMMDALAAQRTEAVSKYGIGSTPTFIFNGGKEKITGDLPLAEFEAVIAKLSPK